MEKMPAGKHYSGVMEFLVVHAPSQKNWVQAFHTTPPQGKMESALDCKMLGKEKNYSKASASHGFTIQNHSLWKEIEKVATSSKKEDRNEADSAVVSFLRSFQEEIARVSKFVDSEEKQLELLAKKVLSTVDQTNKDTTLSVQESKRLEANGLISSHLGLQNYQIGAIDILTKLAAYADSKIGTTCTQMVEQNLQRMKNENSSFVAVLSDIFEALRATEHQDTKDEKWVAPLTFERCTTKYWIENSKMMELLLSVVTEAPLLVYGSKGRLTAAADMKRSEGDKLWNELASTISSVYFDSSEMYLYKERIARHEGAQLFRVRWYGEKKPQGDKLLFLELKTHHEKWVNTKSVKQRVSIREKDMSELLARTKWTATDAEKIVKDADPKLVGTELVKATDLLLTMHNLIVTRDLRPCVRSKYKRVAFQSSKSNDLRLTVDRDIMMIDERSAPRGSWSVPDDTITTAMCTPVPFDVFEVKLAGSDMPDTILSLENRGVIIEAEKFSKFLTGAATFNSSKVGSLPYWAEHPAFHSMFNIPSQHSASSDMDQNTAVGGRSRGRFGRFSTRGQRNSFACSEVGSGFTDVDQGGSVTINQGARSRRSLNPFFDSFASNSSGFSSFQPNTDNTKPRCYDCFRPKGSNQRSVIAAKRPARVEPKSYFANERTFIQWISAALLLVTVSVILLEYAVEHPRYLYIGFLLLTCSAVMVLYSIYAYIRRVRLLSTGQSYGYVDHFGPLFFSFGIIVGLMALLTIFATQSTEDRQLRAGLDASISITEKHNVCYQHKLVGISKLTYQPSDVLLDGERQVLLVPSLDEIVAHPLSSLGLNGARTNATTALVTIPGADLEALVYTPDGILYAVSEKNRQESELIALEWKDSRQQLEIIHKWDIPTPMAEGLAYIPSSDNSPGKLYVAGDIVTNDASSTMSDVALDKRGIIDVYDDPLASDGETLVGHRMNSKVLAEGLLDSKISALQYFEGALYVLHDNAKVVRVWDVANGDVLSEWSLPAVAAGNGAKQWEGFSLERRHGGESSIGRLRGAGDDSSLLLHLSLDSPPQVWSLVVKAGAAPGEIILPDCAAAEPNYS